MILRGSGGGWLWNNPAWAASLGISGADSERERFLVALIGALFVGPSFFFVAYFNDFLRGYYIALSMALAVFCMIWFGQEVCLIIASLLVILPGMFFFVRFLRQHPLPRAEASHG
jgi:hypothetical protein